MDCGRMWKNYVTTNGSLFENMLKPRSFVQKICGDGWCHWGPQQLGFWSAQDQCSCRLGGTHGLRHRAISQSTSATARCVNDTYFFEGIIQTQTILDKLAAGLLQSLRNCLRLVQPRRTSLSLCPFLATDSTSSDSTATSLCTFVTQPSSTTYWFKMQRMLGWNKHCRTTNVFLWVSFSLSSFWISTLT